MDKEFDKFWKLTGQYPKDLENKQKEWLNKLLLKAYQAGRDSWRKEMEEDKKKYL